MKFKLFSAVVLGLASLVLATGCNNKKELWIYTSLYKEVIAEMEPLLKAAIPEAEIKWFQGGSENVAGKVNAELAGGKTKADLILTSDPFWYQELKQSGKLLAYDSAATKDVPSELKDPDHAFVTVRIPLMVMAYHSESLQPDQLPKSWKDLTLPRFNKKLSMGSPLESGTSFTAVALLSRLLGWDYFKDLRKQDLVAAGGNSSVITRIETREKILGVVLLENILKAQAKGSPVKAIYPEDGSIPVPSPIAIMKSTQNPEVAKKIVDWFFSEAAQRAIVKGGMYSPLDKIESPVNAKPWAEVKRQMLPWNSKILAELFSSRDQIKTQFSEIIAH